ncbi:MAG TPA: FMN-binding protein [Patescibacteria group bacterium]|jgi:uncharacterized protein with FMN-binding domain|nr:FMN-binding protein [Patescibacteria group bacterium]
MKKVAISLLTIASFIFYSWHARNEQSNARATLPTTLPAQNSSSSPTTVQPMMSSGLKDGTFTGTPADAVYGNIQVQAVISSGKIVDVVFVSYPNDRNTSIQINQQAMPLLKQEAIQAQSASIDGVTGATDSSQAFIQSLSSALQQAKA